MIRFHLPASAIERLAFAYSPLFEAVLSLHVLVEPKHHPLQHDWVRRMRQLPDRLRRDVHAFAFAYRSYLPQVLAPAPVATFGSFPDDLALLLAHPPETVASEFCVPLTPPGRGRDPARLNDPALRDEITTRGAALGRESGRLVRLLLDDPSAFVNRLVEFLTGYWKAGFAEEWRRTEPLLAGAVSSAGAQIAGDGLYSFLYGLSPELVVDPGAQTIAVKRNHQHDVNVDEETPLTLIPSVYAWPPIRVNCDQPWPLALVYPAPVQTRQLRPLLPPEDLLRVLRALADPARLEMLRLIAVRPRSTQELALLVRMTEAGVSRSLRLLSQGGLLETRRQGRYLLYHLVPGRLDLTAALERFLTPPTP
jgi:DNA-binding transcriptional ArsR family regulator